MACLQILAAPGMPKQVYKEELIDRLVGLVRFHLLHNVLVFYDAALCQAQRPELLNPGAPLDQLVMHKSHTVISSVRCMGSCWASQTRNKGILLSLLLTVSFSQSQLCA